MKMNQYNNRFDLGFAFIVYAILLWISCVIGPWELGLSIFLIACLINLFVRMLFRVARRIHGDGVIKMIMREHFGD